MDRFNKYLKRAAALTVAISMTGGVAFALKSKQDKIKTTDTVVNNVGKIANPQEPTSADDYWTGNYIYFGHYPQSSDGNGGYNNDPIKWRVLNNNNPKDVSSFGDFASVQNSPIGQNGLLVMTDNIIDHARYYTEYDATDVNDLAWGNNGGNNGCTLWAWLNNYSSSQVLHNYSDEEAGTSFLTRFSSNELSSILNTRVHAVDTGTIAGCCPSNTPTRSNSNRSSTTNDKIFLLSASEFLNNSYGFYNNGNSNANTRLFSDTVYSNSRFRIEGKHAHDTHLIIFTRTPGNLGSLPCAISVEEQGKLGYDNGTSGFCGGYRSIAYNGITPVINLDISKILLASKADNTNKLSEISAVPTAFSMPTGYNNEYKLTIKDSSRNFALGNVTQTGKVADISYSGAQTGDNEYISCIIANTNDASDIKYYGKLAKAKSSGKVKIRIPDDSAGYTIKLFNEQCNGVNETDWASEAQELTIDSNGKVTQEILDTTYADVESIEIQPQSHSVSEDGPADQTTVILRGKNFSSNYKATIEFRIDGEQNPVLSYPANGKAFSDTNDTTLTISIPKSEMEKLNDHVGRYTVEAKVETN